MSQRKHGGVMRASRASRIFIIFDPHDAPTVVGDTVVDLAGADFRLRGEVSAVHAGQPHGRITRPGRTRGVGRREVREANFSTTGSGAGAARRGVPVP